MRNHKEKYPIHAFLVEVTRGGWRAEGFADVFCSVRLSLNIASVRFLNTTPGSFCFGAVFYDASVQKSCKASVLYSNKTYQVGVYRVHGVWCANVLCAPVLYLIESTGAILDDKRTEQKTSAKPFAHQPPLVTSTRNGCMGYFFVGFLKNIR